jgi:hypothetical protein
MRWGRCLVWLAGAGFGVVAGCGGFGAAASSSGFVVSPAFQEVKVAAKTPQVQYELKLSNHTTSDQNFRLSVVDFGALDEEGGVAFLGTPARELDHKYGLASWMVLEKDAVFVPAGGAVEVLVTIDNRVSLAPGGHYGAVLATAVNEFGQPLSNSVGVKQVVSSLVLAIKDGGVTPDLRLVGQTANGSWGRLPTRVEHRFQNAGNVHVVPRGVVAVRDSLGRVVERGALNEESAAVLPESFRRYKTPLVRVGRSWLPGVYAVATTYRYDGTDQTKTLVTRFWYAGEVVVWAVALAALAVGVLVWWAFWRRRARRRKQKR